MWLSLLLSLGAESASGSVRKAGVRELRHRLFGETWFHLTDRSRFSLSSTFMPADNSLSIVDRSGQRGVYLARNIEPWVNGHGYWRPFVVEFRVDPSVHTDAGVHGRWGGEMFVPASSFSRLTLTRVVPLDAWAREHYGQPGWVESAVGISFDTRLPVMSVTYERPYQGWRYTGPDVRTMPSEEIAQLRKDLRTALRVWGRG